MSKRELYWILNDGAGNFTSTRILYAYKSDSTKDVKITKDDIKNFISENKGIDFIMYQDQLASPLDVVKTGILHQFYIQKKIKVFRALYQAEYEKTYNGLLEKFNNI